MSKKKDRTRISSNQIIKLPILKTKPWTEIIGEYIGFTTKGKTFYLALHVDGKKYCLSLKKDSKEHQLIKKALPPHPQSVTLCLLFTDDPDEPIRIKRIEGPG